jgi:hypothetical protein
MQPGRHKQIDLGRADRQEEKEREREKEIDRDR